MARMIDTSEDVTEKALSYFDRIKSHLREDGCEIRDVHMERGIVETAQEDGNRCFALNGEYGLRIRYRIPSHDESIGKRVVDTTEGYPFIELNPEEAVKKPKGMLIDVRRMPELSPYVMAYLNGVDISMVCFRANEMTGYYDIYSTDANGKKYLLPDQSGMATERVFGNVELRFKGIGQIASYLDSTFFLWRVWRYATYLFRQNRIAIDSRLMTNEMDAIKNRILD